MSSPHALSSRSHLLQTRERHVDTDLFMREEQPSAAAWTTLSAPVRVPLSDLDMIDVIDTDMRACPGDADLIP